MLDPQTREHIFGLLRPPDEYQLDRAIGTTFSLDLLTLLTVPLAFTFFGSAADSDNTVYDPLALLDGVRRYAERILIFCQAGQIIVPKNNQQLFHYLEDRVFQLVSPYYEQAVFHPKVWLLRYAPIAKNYAIRYRLLVLSRNLTFDRSWDTALSLDGVLSDRQYAYSRNHPLADFFAALPEMWVQKGSFPDREAKIVRQLQEEVRRVEISLPKWVLRSVFYPNRPDPT